jgi:Leucine-rich repeat (LRR) protein
MTDINLTEVLSEIKNIMEKNDKELKELILLDKSKENIIFKDINTLNLSNTSITDLRLLSLLINLKNLNLSTTQITNFTPLLLLTNLLELNLSKTSISDLKPLSLLTNLGSLNLSNTQITIVTPLSLLINLNTLDMNTTQITNITPLSLLTRLNYLNLSETSISDLKPLSLLTNLGSLNLSNTQITIVTPLSLLINLYNLNLSKTLISNLTPLSLLTNLYNLNLSKTLISNLTPLSLLTKLNKLNLSNNKIKNIMDINTLLNKLYKCKIIAYCNTFLELSSNFKIDDSNKELFLSIIPNMTNVSPVPLAIYISYIIRLEKIINLFIEHFKFKIEVTHIDDIESLEKFIKENIKDKKIYIILYYLPGHVNLIYIDNITKKIYYYEPHQQKYEKYNHEQILLMFDESFTKTFFESQQNSILRQSSLPVCYMYVIYCFLLLYVTHSDLILTQKYIAECTNVYIGLFIKYMLKLAHEYNLINDMNYYALTQNIYKLNKLIKDNSDKLSFLTKLQTFSDNNNLFLLQDWSRKDLLKLTNKKYYKITKKYHKILKLQNKYINYKINKKLNKIK